MPTMILSSQSFPNRTAIPNTTSGSLFIQPGGLVKLDAPSQIVALNPIPSQPDDKYNFLFWHVNRLLLSKHAVDFTAPTNESGFFATAWYQKLGGNGPPSPPHWTTFAFSIEQDNVISGTPIAAVTPPGAWTGPPSTVIDTTSAPSVAITAKTLIDGAGEFASWLAFGGSASGRVLTVALKTSGLAIAAFGIPQPDPCSSLRSTRDNLNPGDFRTLADFRKALAAANRALHDCEKIHGEPLD